VNRTIACVVTLSVALFSFTRSAHATPIEYEITGTASGQIGTTTFTNATVDFVGMGDTANVTSFVISGSTVFANPLTAFSVTIGGVGTATITPKSAMWALPGGFGTPTPFVVLGREDKVGGVPVLDSITGLAIVGGSGLSGYEGTTDLGPITGIGGIGFPACGGVGQDPCVATSLGLLSFTSNFSNPPTGIATLDVTNPIPEPTTLFLLGSGLVALTGRYRARARK
jgi:hypothetical protein